MLTGRGACHCCCHADGCDALLLVHPQLLVLLALQQLHQPLQVAAFAVVSAHLYQILLAVPAMALLYQNCHLCCLAVEHKHD